MDLLQEILVNVLQKEHLHVTFPDLELTLAEIVDLRSLQALREIKAALVNDELTDAECFAQIEEIVTIFESIGSSGECRHDL